MDQHLQLQGPILCVIAVLPRAMHRIHVVGCRANVSTGHKVAARSTNAIWRWRCWTPLPKSRSHKSAHSIQSAFDFAVHLLEISLELRVRKLPVLDIVHQTGLMPGMPTSVPDTAHSRRNGMVKLVPGMA
eukprot:1173742-Rhodomonas_salina.4